MIERMIDEKGLRAGVGIILCNSLKQLLFARRIGKQNAWQFPQGGIQEGESAEQAMWRELHEELGLTEDCTQLIHSPDSWFTYYLPKHLRRTKSRPLCIGQKQKWFLLKLIASDNAISLNAHHPAEFNQWKWVDYWVPAKQVVLFKRDLYQKVLQACQSHLNTLP